MAFYDKSSNVARDPSAIDQRPSWEAGIASAVVVLLIIAITHVSPSPAQAAPTQSTRP